MAAANAIGRSCARQHYHQVRAKTFDLLLDRRVGTLTNGDHRD